MTDPWDERYIHLHENQKNQAVMWLKYTIYMDGTVDGSEIRRTIFIPSLKGVGAGELHPCNIQTTQGSGFSDFFSEQKKTSGCLGYDYPPWN